MKGRWEASGGPAPALCVHAAKGEGIQLNERSTILSHECVATKPPSNASARKTGPSGARPVLGPRLGIRDPCLPRVTQKTIFPSCAVCTQRLARIQQSLVPRSVPSSRGVTKQRCWPQTPSSCDAPQEQDDALKHVGVGSICDVGQCRLGDLHRVASWGGACVHTGREAGQQVGPNPVHTASRFQSKTNVHYWTGFSARCLLVAPS